jgi:hypothetical protein
MSERMWTVLKQLLADPTHVLTWFLNWLDVIVVVIVVLAVTLHGLRSLKEWLFQRGKDTEHAAELTTNKTIRESGQIGAEKE